MLFILLSSIVLTSLGITGLAVMKMPSSVPMPPVAAPSLISAGHLPWLLMLVGIVAVFYVIKRMGGAFFRWLNDSDNTNCRNK